MPLDQNISTVNLNPLTTIQPVKETHRKSKKRKENEDNSADRRKKDTVKLSSVPDNQEERVVLPEINENIHNSDGTLEAKGVKIDIVIE